jgi:hypothetical protein
LTDIYDAINYECVLERSVKELQRDLIHVWRSTIIIPHLHCAKTARAGGLPFFEVLALSVALAEVALPFFAIDFFSGMGQRNQGYHMKQLHCKSRKKCKIDNNKEKNMVK